MNFLSKYKYLSTGLAMFSMFFGAGNVIFPLVVGQATGDQVGYALLGLLLTAVGVPFIGLITMILFKGDYYDFFARLGKTPGFLLAAFIMLLIGPFGAIPRCIALSYSTLKTSWPNLSSLLFSGISCLLVFLCTFRKNKILDLLGYVLTPLLLVSLAVILIAGCFIAGEPISSSLNGGQSFMYGLIEGYNTMDLLASFFFSAVVFNGLKHESDPNEKDHEKKLFFLSLKASIIGATLLSIVYIGFSLLAAYHSQGMAVQGVDELLGNLITKVLGSQAGLFASITVALACLTTAIALATIFAEFLQKTLFKNRINYTQSLLVTLLITYGISILEFRGIVTFLSPILQVAYPALIVLTLANMGYRIYQFRLAKTN